MLATRFAPSPTGWLHLGHAFSALTGWYAARASGGAFRLRIEDIDHGRCRAEFDEAILEDLAWLGVDWDGAVRRQSRHMDAYAAALRRLEQVGVLYPCFCTRREIRDEIARIQGAPQGPDGPVYPGTCRAMNAEDRHRKMEQGAAFALRLDVAAALRLTGPLYWRDRLAGRFRADPGLFGDVVLARKDTPASYHLCVAVDDAIQGITLVVRGQDLAMATHVHRLLQALLGLPAPEYLHHGLLVDESGRRLAKRADSLSVRALRHAGHTPGQVRAMAGDLTEPRAEWRAALARQSGLSDVS